MREEPIAYAVYEKGLFVGILELTLEQVRALTAKAVYILQPLDPPASA